MNLFGNEFAYTDSTEGEFSIAVCHFNSFHEAAEEAAISRFYGGIHYIAAIKNGLQEGSDIGRFISGKLKTRNGAISPKKHSKK
ncbi:MAG: hypothetical protein ABJB86_13765 [Bacteroidota bacterium]